MGKIICKPCYETNLNGWKKPFDETITDWQALPEYNENVQHYSVFEVGNLASKLQNGEMLEILCVQCKMTYIGKDPNGVVKVKYLGNSDWTNYNL